MTVTTPSIKLTLGTNGWVAVKTDTLAPAGYSALIAGSSNPGGISNNVSRQLVVFINLRCLKMLL